MRITLLIRAPVAHERDVVLKNLCQMTEAQFRQHWIGKVFRADTALAPKIVYSSEMTVSMVNRFPGAIAFVDASLVGKGLKVMKIDGHAPGEAGTGCDSQTPWRSQDIQRGREGSPLSSFYACALRAAREFRRWQRHGLTAQQLHAADNCEAHRASS